MALIHLANNFQALLRYDSETFLSCCAKVSAKFDNYTLFSRKAIFTKLPWKDLAYAFYGHHFNDSWVNSLDLYSFSKAKHFPQLDFFSMIVKL